jgi:bacillithiol biosynthesis cysteine-adding enzyme BshC
MDCISISKPYRELGYFSAIVQDYLAAAPEIQPFYQHPVNEDGLRRSINARKEFNIDRNLLVSALEKQYEPYPVTDLVKQNIRSLLQENTFTIVTAHQPNIFTGYLYFIYKILHVIKLSDKLSKDYPGYHFVPVFYMGSEDADLEELGKIFMDGEKIVWDTKQKGAVGRMGTKNLDRIIERLEGELGVLPFGSELITLLKDCYLGSPNIQLATLRLVNALFGEYGLVVLVPDNARLKKVMKPVFEDDLFRRKPSVIVEETNLRLGEHYKVQANPREINLFYLKDDIRERIVQMKDEWVVAGTNIRFTETALRQELESYPERFSPNVILRGLFQEMILPNIAFVGGGGELAYWLELKGLFEHYRVPFPVLIMRNSFLFIEKKWNEKIRRLGFEPGLFFKEEEQILNELVMRESGSQLQLENEISETVSVYAGIEETATRTDVTLQQHVKALQARAVSQLKKLEKKMMAAEKRKFEDQSRQIRQIKNKLFPGKALQERKDNFMPYYAKYGKAFIRMIYENSPSLEQEFIILTEV